MRALYVVVSEEIAKDLKLTEIRESKNGKYLLRDKDIAHVQGDSWDEKAERLGGYVLTQTEASKFLKGKISLTKRIINYEGTR